MDFFEHQHLARRHTRWMVAMFIVAVIAVAGALNLFGAVIWAMATEANIAPGRGFFARVPGPIYAAISVVTLGFIGFGSGSCMLRLAAGGSAVAEMVGARPVARDTRDPLERRYLNLVEEMAIASGISLPGVYLMDEEEGINAFAAGYSPNEAVVAITRGALTRLNRDELQGVIGHEFSHILNGDMRLNVHLVGVVAGLVNIGALGRFLMGNRRSDNDRDTDWRIFLAGLALWLIGSIGVLAGNIIKAAISRQREFLADASAVQFTRNPEGIGTALYKIGQQGALIQNRHAEDLSHMYFGEGISSMFGLLDTHPPVEQRIERVMGPGATRLLGDRVKHQDAAPSPSVSGSAFQDPGNGVSAIAEFASRAALSSSGWGRADALVGTSAPALLASVGRPTQAHAEAAREVLARIPAEVLAAANSVPGARALLTALLLGQGETRVQQITAITRVLGADVAREAGHHALALQPLGPRVRMPIMTLIMPALASIPAADRLTLLGLVEELAQADNRVTLGEFVLLTLCRRHLANEIKRAPPVKHSSIDKIAAQAEIILAVIAHSGKGGRHAFELGMRALELQGGVFRTPAELGINVVESALYELKLLAPLKKPAFIKACLAAVMSDGKLTVLEGELMRALCASLDSPLPPLLDTLEPVN